VSICYSSTEYVLQNKCSELASIISLEFNAEKSHYIAIGKMSNKDITGMSLGSNSIQWCQATKYLGVYLQGNRSLKFDINLTKRGFYAACN